MDNFEIKIKIIVHGKKILNLKNIRGTKLKFGNFQEEKKSSKMKISNEL